MRVVVTALFILLACSSAVALESIHQGTVESVRIVLAKKGSNVEVQQSFRLNPEGISAKKISLKLPHMARNAKLTGEGQKGVELKGDKLIVDSSALQNPVSTVVLYDFPIEDGAIVLDQMLSVDVQSLQVISTWTLGDTKLDLEGFGIASKHAILGGLEALVVSANNIQGGHIRVKLTGLNKRKVEYIRVVAISMSIAFLLGGFIFWIRKKMGDNE